MLEFITATLAVIIMTFAATPHHDPSIHAYTQDYGSNTVVVEGYGWQPLTWISIHAKNTDTYIRSNSNGLFETSLTLDTQRSNSEVKITASAGQITRRLSVTIIGDDKPPTITLAPSVVGIRDYVTISGTGWDVRNHPRVVTTFTVDDIETSLVENLNEFGGFSSVFRVTPWAAAPGLINVSVTDGNHSIHATVRIIAPSIEMLDERAHADDQLSFFATDLSVYAEVLVEIDAIRVDLPYMVTDRDGSVEFTLPASLEPGAHIIKVTTNIGPMNHAGTAFYVHEE